MKSGDLKDLANMEADDPEPGDGGDLGKAGSATNGQQQGSKATKGHHYVAPGAPSLMSGAEVLKDELEKKKHEAQQLVEVAVRIFRAIIP
jgi:hypothetical protein